MERLSRSDLQAILGFLEFAYGAASEEPFPPAVLESLSSLVACDELSYTELDRVRKRVIREVAYREDGPERGPGMETFWRLVHEHPLCAQSVARRFGALKISDFVTSRELRRREIYSEWFRPWETEQELEVGIPSPLRHTKTLVFGRSKARPDFDERDRSVLIALQPHLIQLYRNATLRQHLADGWGDGVVAGDLTDRERERSSCSSARGRRIRRSPASSGSRTARCESTSSTSTGSSALRAEPPPSHVSAAAKVALGLRGLACRACGRSCSGAVSARRGGPGLHAHTRRVDAEEVDPRSGGRRASSSTRTRRLNGPARSQRP